MPATRGADPGSGERDLTAVPASALDDGTPDARWLLAAERTLLAWFRLSLALFLVGLVPLALVPTGTATVLVTVMSGALMVGCAAAAVEGLRRWRGATGPR